MARNFYDWLNDQQPLDIPMAQQRLLEAAWLDGHKTPHGGAQYKLEIVRSTPITVPHLRLKPPRGGEIILSGEQLVNMAGARRTAKHLAEAARRGFRIVEVIEAPKVIA